MSFFLKCCCTLFAWFALFSAQAAPKVPIPGNIQGATNLDAEGLIELAGKTPNLVIVDSRIAGDRKMGYIENSVSLPDIHTDCRSLAKVIPDKATPALFYCNGVKCGRSVVATRIALKCGYSRLYWFRGGFEEWRGKRYPYLRQ